MPKPTLEELKKNIALHRDQLAIDNPKEDSYQGMLLKRINRFLSTAPHKNETIVSFVGNFLSALRSTQDDFNKKKGITTGNEGSPDYNAINFKAYNIQGFIEVQSKEFINAYGSVVAEREATLTPEQPRHAADDAKGKSKEIPAQAKTTTTEASSSSSWFGNFVSNTASSVLGLFAAPAQPAKARPAPSANKSAIGAAADPSELKPLKILVIGDSSVGKSSFLLQLAGKGFSENFISTIGVDHIDANVNGRTCILFDTQGMDRFQTVIPQTNYRNAHAIIIMFDLTNSDSFNSVDKWRQEIERYAPGNVSVLVVGNKSDLIGERQVTAEKINEFCKLKELDRIEISAKAGTKVQAALDKIVGVYEANNEDKATSSPAPRR